MVSGHIITTHSEDTHYYIEVINMKPYPVSVRQDVLLLTTKIKSTKVTTLDVLTFGAKKYGDNNWVKLDNGIERYFAALMRHLVAWRSGEWLDKESSKPHLAHAMCCLIFIFWLSLKKEIK